MLGGILAAVTQRDFWSERRILDHATRTVEETAKRLYTSLPDADRARAKVLLRAMLLFSTSKQRTWLVTDGCTLYSVLDDVRREEPSVQGLATGPDLQPVRAQYDQSPETGVVYFSKNGKDWLFSKDLFPDGDVVAAIHRFLNRDTA